MTYNRGKGCETVGRKLLIGVVCEKAYAENVSGVIKGIIAQAFRINCDIVVLSALQSESEKESRYIDSEMDVFKLMLTDRFDGFLYISRSFGSEKRRSQTEQLLMRTGRPVMIAGGHEHNIFENTIQNERHPFERITDHLIDVHGCRVIYFMSGAKGDPACEDRISGFCDSMKRHGLYYDRNSFINIDAHSFPVSRFVDSIVSGKLARPDAVVCSDNTIAASLIDCLCSEGINVPEDIAVTGFDCTGDETLPFCNITSWRKDDFQLGADSLRKLYRMITGNSASRITDKGGGFHIGASCGCRTFGRAGFGTDRRKIVTDRFNGILSDSPIAAEYLDEKDIEDALIGFCGYARYIYRFHSFDICLTSDYMQSVGKGSRSELQIGHRSDMIRYMSVLSSGEIICCEQKFKARDILPVLKENDRRPTALFVNLLRNRNGEYGYTALSFGKNCESLSAGYSRFIYELSIILERFGNMPYHNLMGETGTGTFSLFPPLYIFEKSRRRNADIIVTVEIRSIRRLFLENESTDFRVMITEFEEILGKSLDISENCAIVTHGLYAVLTDRKPRAEQLYRELKSSNVISLLGRENCIAFSSAEIPDSGYSLADAVKMALLNDKSGYVIDGRVTPNPLYEKLCMLRERMQIYPQLDWSIETISRELGISKSYLQKYYRENFGMSIIDSLIHIRMDKAKKLLRETNLTVTAIAEKCGYSSYIHFTKQFRKAENTTPTNYRMKNRADVDI